MSAEPNLKTRILMTKKSCLEIQLFIQRRRRKIYQMNFTKTVTFEYHPIMAFDKTTEEMAVPMEINVKSALNDIFEGENVPLEGEEKPVKKEEDPEQDEGVERSVFQLAETGR